MIELMIGVFLLVIVIGAAAFVVAWLPDWYDR